MNKPIIAIVGRPNVGKSQLFNRLAGQKLSIVQDTPGVTRDRLYTDIVWRDRTLALVDTGGIEPRVKDGMLKFMREQAQIAIDAADVIVLLTDLQTGVTAADQDVAAMLQRSGKPIVLAVNKADRPGPTDPDVYGFYNLGLGDPIAISAVHGLGMGDLLDACVEHLPDDSDEQEDDPPIGVAIIGKPNVGKSSLLNKILGHERVIVSDVAGTTRDAVDTPYENNTGRYTLIDTAGMRRRARIDNDIEYYSVLRTVMAVERADVALILIDATEGVTEQDTKVAGLAHQKGKPSVIIVNKWDLVEKDEKTMQRMREEIAEHFKFMAYAPIHFISALTGQRVNGIFELVQQVIEQSRRRVTTGALNDMLSRATARVQPPSDKGRRLKVFYVTQVDVSPPTFVMFVNDSRLFHFSYKRYLENNIRETFGLNHTPLKVLVRSKTDEAGEE